MADLVKSVLGGAWSLIIGWILPTYISFQLIAALVLPGMREFQPVGEFYQFSSPTRQFALLAAAAVAGLVLAAAQAPLYRILEGYLLWPASIGNRRIKRHQERHRELTDAQAVAAKANKGVRSGLLYERAARYPVQERQFAPTALGNAIRRFETYARDRYMLDSQLLWHHLTAAAPDRAVAAVDNARANVDFFVCLLYGGSAMATLGIAVVASGHASVQSGVATAAGIVIATGLPCWQPTNGMPPSARLLIMGEQELRQLSVCIFQQTSTRSARCGGRSARWFGGRMLTRKSEISRL